MLVAVSPVKLLNVSQTQDFSSQNAVFASVTVGLWMNLWDREVLSTARHWNMVERLCWISQINLQFFQLSLSVSVSLSLRVELRLPPAASLRRRISEQSALRRGGFLLLPDRLPAARPQCADLPQCQHPLLERQGTTLPRWVNQERWSKPVLDIPQTEGTTTKHSNTGSRRLLTVFALMVYSSKVCIFTFLVILGRLMAQEEEEIMCFSCTAGTLMWSH